MAIKRFSFNGLHVFSQQDNRNKNNEKWSKSYREEDICVIV